MYSIILYYYTYFLFCDKTNCIIGLLNKPAGNE